MSPLSFFDGSVKASKSGIAFTLKLDTSLQKYVVASVTLLLRWFEFAAILVVVALASAIFTFRHELAKTWLLSAWAPQNLLKASIFIGLLTLAVGCFLAFWKRKQLFVYSIWEIVFGSLSAGLTAYVHWPNGETAKFVALGSALYVVSRGADNFTTAFQKEADIERLKLEFGAGNALQPIWPFWPGETPPPINTVNEPPPAPAQDPAAPI
jgi:hypothetical protein